MKKSQETTPSTPRLTRAQLAAKHIPHCYISRDKRMLGWQKAIEIWEELLQEKINQDEKE